MPSEIFTYFSIQQERPIFLLFFFFFLHWFNNLKSSDLKYLETVKSFDSLFLDRISVSIPLMTPPHLILYVKTITRPPHYLHSLSLFLESHLYVTKRKKKINSRFFPRNWLAAYGLIKWKAEKRITWKIHWVFKL